MSASDNKIIIWAALVGNFCIAIVKFIAAFITSSSAMYSEGIHSLVDTGNQVLLLYGLKRAKLPPSSKFPYGHGKEIYFWSFVVAILIFALGSGLSIKQGFHHLYSGQQITNVKVSYIVLICAIVFESIPWFLAYKQFNKVKGQRGFFEAVKRGKDPSLFLVLFEDTAAMLGLVVALIGIYLSDLTGNPIYDAVASIIIGVILGLVAMWLAFETKSLLIGESADYDVVNGIKGIARGYRAIEKINEVLTMHIGPDYILVNISIEFNDNLQTDSMEKIISAIDREIKHKYPRVKRVFIEAESK